MTGATATVQGRLTADPILRYTESGIPVANFSVAHTPRKRNLDTGLWEDSGESLFLDVTVWREQAENAAASLHKADHVVCLGRLRARSFEVEGVKRTKVEFEADTVAVDLRFQTASVTRITRPMSEAGGEPWGVPQAVKDRSAA